jgi:hypothetical protein
MAQIAQTIGPQMAQMTQMGADDTGWRRRTALPLWNTGPGAVQLASSALPNRPLAESSPPTASTWALAFARPMGGIPL